MKDDGEIVREAVAHDGYALEFASDRLRSDMETVLIAVGQNSEAIQYVSENLWDNEDIRRTAGIEYDENDDFWE